MAGRSTGTRQEEAWGEVMQLPVRGGIGESECEHLRNHHPTAFRDGQRAVGPIKGWDIGLCRQSGYCSRRDAAAPELGCRGLVYRRPAPEHREAQAAQSAARACEPSSRTRNRNLRHTAD